MGGQSASLGTQSGPILISPAGQVIPLFDHNDQVDPLSDVHAVTLHGWAAGSSQEDTCTQTVAWLANPGQTYPEFRLGVCGEAYGITDDWYVIGIGTSDGSFNPRHNRRDQRRGRDQHAAPCHRHDHVRWRDARRDLERGPEDLAAQRIGLHLWLERPHEQPDTDAEARQHQHRIDAQAGPLLSHTQDRQQAPA
jgi:hypothetical protein